ncbi:MAG: hypothetical protein ACOYK8_09170 [Alphaproteobacteria bacterium]
MDELNVFCCVLGSPAYEFLKGKMVDPRLITSNRFGQFYDAMLVLGKTLENPPILTKIFKFEPLLAA